MRHKLINCPKLLAFLAFQGENNVVFTKIKASTSLHGLFNVSPPQPGKKENPTVRHSIVAN